MRDLYYSGQDFDSSFYFKKTNTYLQSNSKFSSMEFNAQRFIHLAYLFYTSQLLSSQHYIFLRAQGRTVYCNFSLHISRCKIQLRNRRRI